MSNIAYLRHKFGALDLSYQKTEKLEDESPKLLKLWKNQFLSTHSVYVAHKIENLLDSLLACHTMFLFTCCSMKSEAKKS